jgi:hypothetical protein
MRLLALLLVVAVPSASFARGLGPDEDAPVVRQPPSARLLPVEEPVASTVPSPDAASSAGHTWLWVGLGLASLTVTVLAIVLGVMAASFHPPVPVQSSPPPGFNGLPD